MLVYAFFFASTNLFVHSHQFRGYTVVHSHPGKAATHTADQIQLISILDNSTYDASDMVIAPESDVVLVCDVTTVAVCDAFVSDVPLSSSLRAPPYRTYSFS